MSIITLPVGLELVIGIGFGQARYDMVESSDATGAENARLFGPPRWRASLLSPSAMRANRAAQWEALVLRLRGSINRLAVHDPVRPVPLGSMRGSPVLAATAAAGADTASITATGTLLAGDWLQFGTGLGSSQLVKVMEDATASAGAIAVQFEPPLRKAYAAGTVVTWDKPLAYYRAIGNAPSWTYSKNGLASGGFALDLLEAFS